MIFYTRSEKETKKIGVEIMERFANKKVFLLEGDLGTGKTVMIKGMVKKLGIEEVVSSPSFVIVKEYKEDDICVYHLDLYRIDSGYEITDIYDMIASDCYLFVEWGEKIRSFFRNIPHVVIRIEDIGIKERRIEVESSGN